MYMYAYITVLYTSIDRIIYYLRIGGTVFQHNHDSQVTYQFDV